MATAETRCLSPKPCAAAAGRQRCCSILTRRRRRCGFLLSSPYRGHTKGGWAVQGGVQLCSCVRQKLPASVRTPVATAALLCLPPGPASPCSLLLTHLAAALSPASCLQLLEYCTAHADAFLMRVNPGVYDDFSEAAFLSFGRQLHAAGVHALQVCRVGPGSERAGRAQACFSTWPWWGAVLVTGVQCHEVGSLLEGLAGLHCLLNHAAHPAPTAAPRRHGGLGRQGLAGQAAWAGGGPPRHMLLLPPSRLFGDFPGAPGAGG